MYLSPCTLAKIFRGAITSWNDAAIVADNPGFEAGLLTSDAIRVVHRNNGSSSTYGLTHYLKG